jgi:hypothetical protein
MCLRERGCTRDGNRLLVSEVAEEEESDGAELYAEGNEKAAEVIAGLVRAYHETGSSGNEVFDKRVRVTLAGMDTALEWIASQNPAVLGRE